MLAALSFGVTTPVIARAGQHVGALSTAALLYFGACASALVLGRVSPAAGAPLGRSQRLRLALIGVVGAGVAPTLLAWGLQRVGATTGSLLLNLEAAFTVLLAWLLYREPIGRRVLGALTAMALGGVALSFDVTGVAWSPVGVLAIVGATFAWALDNTLTRALSEQDPVAIVAGKGAVGASLTGVLAWALGEPLPGLQSALVLLACGATGYGLSLRLYLLAQRRIGAARTGSIFALAPFVGAALAWAVGDQPLGPLTVVAAGLFALGLWLHLTEHHEHPHRHLEVEHDHPHRHDDGHHTHVHAEAVAGEHSHPHHHDAVAHVHDHAPDVHHDHVH